MSKAARGGVEISESAMKRDGVLHSAVVSECFENCV